MDTKLQCPRVQTLALRAMPQASRRWRGEVVHDSGRGGRGSTLDGHNFQHGRANALCYSAKKREKFEPSACKSIDESPARSGIRQEIEGVICGNTNPRANH